MTSAETDILRRLLTRIAALERSLDEDIQWLEHVPADLAAFDAMPSHRRSASRAVLKSFEQIEDQLARAFRVLPKLLGEDSSRWYARDHADFAEKLGVIDSAARWSMLVKLRNELVHDYPLDADVQFGRLLQAIDFLPDLKAAHRGLVSFVSTHILDR